jgi:hypothetical protein
MIGSVAENPVFLLVCWFVCLFLVELLRMASQHHTSEEKDYLRAFSIVYSKDDQCTKMYDGGGESSTKKREKEMNEERNLLMTTTK